MTDSKQKVVSNNAIARVLALQASALKAAQSILREDGYSDFFVEGGGGSWHEAFGDVVSGDVERPNQFTTARMAMLDALKATAADGYSDFFVEGGGGSWHEAFGDVVSGDVETNLVASAGARVAALSKLSVVQAYATLKAGGFAKK